MTGEDACAAAPHSAGGAVAWVREVACPVGVERTGPTPSRDPSSAKPSDDFRRPSFQEGPEL
jgi:hypothetical protein